MLTDVVGVLDKSGKLITELTVSEAEALIRDGTVSGGMIPVETCINAVLGGAEAAVIMDGRALPRFRRMFTEHGMGTFIKAGECRAARRSHSWPTNINPPPHFRQMTGRVFDLDNTIYPAKSNLFVRVAVRITAFVAQHFNVPEDEARVIQKDLFHHGDHHARPHGGTRPAA